MRLVHEREEDSGFRFILLHIGNFESKGFYSEFEYYFDYDSETISSVVEALNFIKRNI